MAVGLKICGVSHPDDASLCVALGVTSIGLNFWSGSKRGVTPSTARTVADAARGGPTLVGVFVDAPPGQVAAIAATVGLDAIQPHGDREPGPYAALGLPWIWVIRRRVAPADLVVPQPAPCWVLLDAPTPGFGGQGVTADWTWAAAVVAALSPLPVWLAGGLHPGNAHAALRAVGPAGLDVASGSELGAQVGTDQAPRKNPAAIAALASICGLPGRP